MRMPTKIRPTSKSGRRCKAAAIWAIGLFGVAAVVMAGVGLIGCYESASKPPSQTPSDEVAVKPVVEQATGFVLFFSGNWGGQLEPCGCTAKQLGGIDRRTKILQAVDQDVRLLLDAGSLIERDDRQAQLKLETFLYSLGQLGYDALTFTAREINILRENLGMDADLRPPIIATNMAAEAQEIFGSVGYLEKTLRFDGNQLDCLVLAVSDPRDITGRSREQLQLQDPVAAVEAALQARALAPDQPSKDKLVIVMFPDVDEKRVAKLRQIVAIDILVKIGITDEPEMIRDPQGGPVLITTGKLGKYVARLDIPVENAATAVNAKFHAIAVEEHFLPDTVIVGYIDAYQLQMEAEDLIIDEHKLGRMALPEGLSFVGSSTCGAADCHQGIYDKWGNFSHAHALDTLQEANRQYDPECVSCHTVGMRYYGGYRSEDLTPDLANVGCEACHGPGSAHAADPSAEDPLSEYGLIFMSCEECHTSERSPNFYRQRAHYFDKIRHW